MKVDIISEYGFDEAMIGLSLSYNNPNDMAQVADKLCKLDDGHNKFLESVIVYLDITAPRYWWQQFDTYRVGVTKQSESTMHTIMKRQLTQSDFEFSISDDYLNYLNYLIENKIFDELKSALSEGFLQRRIVCTNYKVIRHIIKQRLKHRLAEWQTFCYSLYNGLEYSRWLDDLF